MPYWISVVHEELNSENKVSGRSSNKTSFFELWKTQACDWTPNTAVENSAEVIMEL